MHHGSRFNLRMAQNLVEFISDPDYEFVVAFIEEGHSGPGVYVFDPDTPEDGMHFLGRSETTQLIMDAADATAYASLSH